ncbi:hypothetical protein HOD75_01560, partial [archaeon]|nr:hypothetical protein [archaeon]MBT4241565.1 hypothetical protein [archaeon]MBT4417960.1 hypothetical protein [archaeon]
TTVLIILVVLVAVVIVWNVVQNMVTESADDVDVQPFALDADLSYYLEDVNTGVFEVKRGTGGGEINEVRLIFTLNDGSSVTYLNDSLVPKVLETEEYKIESSELGLVNFSDIEYVAVHYGYGDNEVTRQLDRIKVSVEPGIQCNPETCVSLGNLNCGDVSDGCGNIINCGSCEVWDNGCVNGKCDLCMGPYCNIPLSDCKQDGWRMDTSYILTKHIYATGDCFKVRDSAILDLNGYGIIGDGTGNGIYVGDEPNVVKNGRITNFSNGLNLFDGATTVENIASCGNIDYDIYCNDGTDFTRVIFGTKTGGNPRAGVCKDLETAGTCWI